MLQPLSPLAFSINPLLQIEFREISYVYHKREYFDNYNLSLNYKTLKFILKYLNI